MLFFNKLYIFDQLLVPGKQPIENSKKKHIALKKLAKKAQKVGLMKTTVNLLAKLDAHRQRTVDEELNETKKTELMEIYNNVLTFDFSALAESEMLFKDMNK